MLFTSIENLQHSTGKKIYEYRKICDYQINASLYSPINFEHIDSVLLNADVYFRRNEVRKEHGLAELGFLANPENRHMVHVNEMGIYFL